MPREAITIQRSIDRLMNAEEEEIQPVAEEVMDLVEHLNGILNRGLVDLSGIVPDEDETDATTITAPYPEEEDELEESDLDAPDTPDEEQEREHGEATGYHDENGELLPDIKAALDNAKRDRRSTRKRGTEQERWEILFVSGYIAAKLNDRRGVAELSHQLDVRPRTLRNWRSELRDDSGWRPWEPRVSFGERNQKIDDEMAEYIIGRVRDDFIAKHRPVTAAALRPIFQASWEMTHGPEDPWPGVCDRTIHRFLHKNKMSWRRRHIKRRPTVPSGVMESFTQQMMELIRTIPRGDILNADETCWILNANGFYTWAPRGCENVQTWIDGNEKQSYTVMATVASDGTALPLQIIVKGKTRRSLRELTGIAPHVAHFSKKGWQTAETLCHYLRWVRGQPRFACGRRIVLLLDSYSAHRCDEVRRFAEGLRIDLVFVPAGCTDALQPCDRYVFGAFKAIYHRYYRCEVEGRCTKAHFVSMLVRAWAALPASAIVKAWAHFRA